MDTSKEEEEIGISFSYYYCYISTAVHGQSGAHRPTAPIPIPVRKRPSKHPPLTPALYLYHNRSRSVRPSPQPVLLHPPAANASNASRTTRRLGSTGAFTCWTGLLRYKMRSSRAVELEPETCPEPRNLALVSSTKGLRIVTRPKCAILV